MDYIHQPMITYLGNKRKLVHWIQDIIQSVPHARVLDAFAGSGVVSRTLRLFCTELHSNDMERYSHILLRCYLETPCSEQRARIAEHSRIMETLPGVEGFIGRLYSPLDTAQPQKDERCFYTRENAMRIDAWLAYVFSVEEDIRHYLLGPLLVGASIHVNTAGVFRGFYKKDGVGHFGGAGEHALERILAPLLWKMPVWTDVPCDVRCYSSDAQELIAGFAPDSLDVIYLDPPYNEHPYGSNYFMLNLIAANEEPVEMSRVSGIPVGWNKSDFNGRGKALPAMKQLLSVCLRASRHTLISYNNEGLITDAQWDALFKELDCHVITHEKVYDAYHGSRNRAARSQTVMERMYLIHKN